VAAAATWWSILCVYMGVYIADSDATGAVLVRNPLTDNESKDWLWRGTYSTSENNLAGSTTFTSFQNDPIGEGTACNGSHIDVRVKRKIRKEESIVLSVLVTEDFPVGSIANAAWQVQLNGQLRALVLLP